MVPVLAAFCVWSAAIVLEERLPLAMLVIAGDGELESAFTADQVVEKMSAALAKHTSLAPQQFELPKNCPEKARLGCWVDAVVTPELEPRYLLVLSFQHEAGAGLRVATLLIDVPAARRIVRSPEAAREDELAQRAASATDVISGDGDALAEYFDILIGQKFRADFEANQHFDPYGTISLDTPRSGYRILLDGRFVGTSSRGETLLENVLPGRRTLLLIDSENEARTQTILTVRSKETSTFSAVAVQAPPLEGPSYRQLTFWTGIGLATAGTAVAIWGLTAKPREGHTFATLCETSERDASCADRGGPLAAPLGYSVALIGGIWAAGSELSDDEQPWIPFVIGLAAGAISYGVSAALDGSDPMK